MEQWIDQNPFLFAFGVPRSGTTLLQRMLDSHPALAVANDSHFIPRALEKTDERLLEDAERGMPIPLTPELAARVGSYHRFERLGVDSSEFESIQDQSDTYQELVSRLYTAVARKSNKRLAGEKTPDYVLRVRLLHGLFPNAKLIHLVRDGRNVALSLLQWSKPNKGPGRIALWNEHPVAVCALWWRWSVMKSREQASTVDHHAYFELRYEDIIAEPSHWMRETCQFLGLPFSEQMVEYHRGRAKPHRRGSAKSAWLAPQHGLRNWESEMDTRQIELFEVLAMDALHEFGYKPHSHGYSDQTLETAKLCQAWWVQHFLPKYDRSHRQLAGKNPAARAGQRTGPD